MNTKTIIWVVFLFTLAVLLPHTAWFFRQFEPDTQYNLFNIGIMIVVGDIVSWVAAIAFESAIAVFAHKLSQRIEIKVRGASDFELFRKRYINPYAFGLLLAWGISTTANYAHAVEYGKEIALFTQWGIGVNIASLVSGAVLPTCSFIFAWILSDVNYDEQKGNDELTAAKSEITTLRGELKKFQSHAGTINELFSNVKSDKIRAIIRLWPDLQNNAIALMAGSKDSQVSRIRKEFVKPSKTE